MMPLTAFAPPSGRPVGDEKSPPRQSAVMGTADKTHLFEPAGAERAAPLRSSSLSGRGARSCRADRQPRVIAASDPAWRGRPRSARIRAAGPGKLRALPGLAHLGVPVGTGGRWLVALAHDGSAFDANFDLDHLAPIAASVALPYHAGQPSAGDGRGLVSSGAGRPAGRRGR